MCALETREVETEAESSRSAWGSGTSPGALSTTRPAALSCCRCARPGYGHQQSGRQTRVLFSTTSGPDPLRHSTRQGLTPFSEPTVRAVAGCTAMLSGLRFPFRGPASAITGLRPPVPATEQSHLLSVPAKILRGHGGLSRDPLRAHVLYPLLAQTCVTTVPMWSVAGSLRPASWARTVPPHERQNRDRLLKMILPPAVHRVVQVGAAYVSPAGFSSANSWSCSPRGQHTGPDARGAVCRRKGKKGFPPAESSLHVIVTVNIMYAEHDARACAHAHAHTHTRLGPVRLERI